MAAHRAVVQALSNTTRPALLALSGRRNPVAVTAAWYGHERNVLNAQFFHSRLSLFLQQTTPDPSGTGNPLVNSMARSTSPSGQGRHVDAQHAAFLGEADSNDGHETFRDIHAKPHEPVDSTNAAFLGEADCNDSFEVLKDVEGRRQILLDAKNAAYLGEADSDDAFEADFEENPEAHRHRIDAEDAKNAAFLGEADSNDQHEADREKFPERYTHKIEDVSPSGIHGETGNQDQ